MSMFEHIKEMIAPDAAEEADAWAARWFPGARQHVAGVIVHLVRTAAGCGYDRMTDKSHLSKDLGMNELQRVQLLLAVEKQFGFEIPDREGEQIDTLEQLVSYAHGRTKISEPAAKAGNE